MGSRPVEHAIWDRVVRSHEAGVAELADAEDLKSLGP